MIETDRIRMVDLQTQYAAIKDEIDAAISEVIEAGSFIRGPFVGTFECKLAGHLGGPFVLGVGNGTDALQIAYMALGIGPGDEVITTPFSFIATAEAAAVIGASPVFVDIEEGSFNIDPEQIEAAITPRTKAIVPVHLFGLPANMDRIMEIAKKHGIPVIEDAAQAVGAQYKGTSVGFIGDIGTISFFPSKNLGAFGDGGAITTNSEALYKTCRMLGNHGSEKKYHNERDGINSRLDALQAAILTVKLKYLDDYANARKLAATRYDERLNGINGVITPVRSADEDHVFHQYTIRITGPLAGKRDLLSGHLKENDIPHAVYYPIPMHRLPVYAEACKDVHLPVAEKAAQEVISLPMHTELPEDQQDRITEVIRSFATS